MGDGMSKVNYCCVDCGMFKVVDFTMQTAHRLIDIYVRSRRNSIRCILLTKIIIVISKLLKRYSKAKRTRAPAYSRALRRIKGGFPKGGQEKLRSEFQSTR